MPGWQVISWVVILALPITVPASAAIWLVTHAHHDPTAGAWTSLVLLGASSMYLGFFAWYRGLALAGIARGGQVQQLQALLTLMWSALLLREHLTRVTVARGRRRGRVRRVGTTRARPGGGCAVGARLLDASIGN